MIQNLNSLSRVIAFVLGLTGMELMIWGQLHLLGKKEKYLDRYKIFRIAGYGMLDAAILFFILLKILNNS